MFDLYTKDIVAATSSKGNQEKWFDRESEQWYKLDTGCFEAYAETVAAALFAQSNIEQELGFSVVRYQVAPVSVHQKQHIACVSSNFLQEGQELITLAHLLKRVVGADYQQVLFGGRKTIPQKVEALVNAVSDATGLQGFGAYLTLLLECDMLILNEDRHLNNIAVVRGADGYSYCPLFDHGISFLLDPNTYPLDVQAEAFVKQVRARPFQCSFAAGVRAARALYGRQIVLPAQLTDFYQATEDAAQEYPKFYQSYLKERVCSVVELQRKKL